MQFGFVPVMIDDKGRTVKRSIYRKIPAGAVPNACNDHGYDGGNRSLSKCDLLERSQNWRVQICHDEIRKRHVPSLPKFNNRLRTEWTIEIFGYLESKR